MQTVKMICEEFKTEDIAIHAEGKYAVFARIARKLDSEIEIKLTDEVTVGELISSKYYDTYDIAQILMPGLGIHMDLT